METKKGGEKENTKYIFHLDFSFLFFSFSTQINQMENDEAAVELNENKMYIAEMNRAATQM